MRDNLTTYQIWAPEEAGWTQWAKPVLFTRAPYGSPGKLTLAEVNWILQKEQNTLVIIDLPGKEGVEEGLALARLGYRPVPLYNGVFGPNAAAMIVKVEEIVTALFLGAEELASLNLHSDAPPVFLLDSNRMKVEGNLPGKYDNRWCVFPQDMPSASYLIKNGIHKVIVRTAALQNDLSHILNRYQEQGIKIYLCNGNAPVKEATLVKPSNFKGLIYRFKVITGLVRNGAGGFGGKIPEPTQSGSSSGPRFYRFG